MYSTLFIIGKNTVLPLFKSYTQCLARKPIESTQPLQPLAALQLIKCQMEPSSAELWKSGRERSIWWTYRPTLSLSNNFVPSSRVLSRPEMSPHLLKYFRSSWWPWWPSRHWESLQWFFDLLRTAPFRLMMLARNNDWKCPSKPFCRNLRIAHASILIERTIPHHHCAIIADPSGRGWLGYTNSKIIRTCCFTQLIEDDLWLSVILCAQSALWLRQKVIWKAEGTDDSHAFRRSPTDHAGNRLSPMRRVNSDVETGNCREFPLQRNRLRGLEKERCTYYGIWLRIYKSSNFDSRNCWDMVSVLLLAWIATILGLLDDSKELAGLKTQFSSPYCMARMAPSAPAKWQVPVQTFYWSAWSVCNGGRSKLSKAQPQ